MNRRGPDLFENLSSWVRTILYSQFVEGESSVMELACGTARDMGKIGRLKTGIYVGIDDSEESILVCLSEYKNRKSEFSGSFSFHSCNPFKDTFVTAKNQDTQAVYKIERHEHKDLGNLQLEYDCILTNGGLDTASESEEMMDTFLWNVSKNLKDKGYFCGVVADSAEIWDTIDKSKATAGKMEVKKNISILGNITISLETKDFQHYGTGFQIARDDKQPYLQGYITHFSTLIKIAERHGLKMIHIMNFKEYYELHHRAYAQGLKAHKVEPSQVNGIAKLSGLFACFIFQKDELGQS